VTLKPDGPCHGFFQRRGAVRETLVRRPNARGADACTRPPEAAIAMAQMSVEAFVEVAVSELLRRQGMSVADEERR
jgi:hypothetical protein